MLTTKFWPIADDITDMWFQQDAVACHAVTESMSLLQTKFLGRIISGNSAVN